MAKRRAALGAPPPAPAAKIRRQGWRVIALGAAVTAAGFVALSRVDATGRNAAAVAAPLLILGGYAAIGLGIFL